MLDAKQKKTAALGIAAVCFSTYYFTKSKAFLVTGVAAVAYLAWEGFSAERGTAPAGSGNYRAIEAKALEVQGPEFLAKAQAIEKELGMPRGTLPSIMWMESGMNPQAYLATNGAGGLIGFLRSTSQNLFGGNPTHEQILAMNGVNQLDYVKGFYQYWLRARPGQAARSSGRAEDWYLLTFYPAAVGQRDNYVIGAPGSAAYNMNSALDFDRNGVLTKGDFLEYIRRKPRAQITVFGEQQKRTV